MDLFCKNILIDITKSVNLINLFEICGFYSINDLIHINDDVLDAMEKYIYEFLLYETDREKYSDSRFMLTSSGFLFSPGLRMKILRAVKRIKNESCRSNASAASVGSDREESATMGDTARPINGSATVATAAVTVCGVNWRNSASAVTDVCVEREREVGPVTGTGESQATSGGGRSSLVMNIEKKEEILSIWAQSVIERVSKKYSDVKLQFKTDFDLDISVQYTESGPRFTGIFICKLCQSARGQIKSIKFSVSKESYVILSNVITHLKLHFSAPDKIYPPPSQVI